MQEARPVTAALAVSAARSGSLTHIYRLVAIPEEEIWLAKQKNRQT
jgi:hypothetical protein